MEREIWFKCTRYEICMSRCFYRKPRRRQSNISVQPSVRNKNDPLLLGKTNDLISEREPEHEWSFFQKRDDNFFRLRKDSPFRNARHFLQTFFSSCFSIASSLLGAKGEIGIGLWGLVSVLARMWKGKKRSFIRPKIPCSFQRYSLLYM